MLPSMACLPTGGVADQPKRSSYRPGEVALREIRLREKQIQEKRKQREENWAFVAAQQILAGDPDYETTRQRLKAVLEEVYSKQPKATWKHATSLLTKALKTLMDAKDLAQEAGYRAGGYRPVYGHQRRPRRR